MVRFECDNCHSLKEPGEAWILGFAAENIGAVSARRELSIAPAWDDDRAVEWLAVHFCSDECRVQYTEKLFGADVAPVVESVEVVPTETPRRATRTAPRKPPRRPAA
jgi:hypothetical protein